MTTSTPAPSCRSCGSSPALPDGELCAACRHAVEYHGASFVEAFAVPCPGDCDLAKLETSPETPTPCVNCGSTACEWPGECKPGANECSRAAGHLALEVACSHIGPNTAAVLREYVAQLERAADRLVVK